MSLHVKRKLQEEVIVGYINEIRAIAPKIGIRKLWVMYQREFIKEELVGRDIFESVAARHGFKIRKKYESREQLTPGMGSLHFQIWFTTLSLLQKINCGSAI
jgi:hypothetical protein